MDERWSGDGTYYLPARQVEPYRLWFEFLKQAHRDADIEIDHSGKLRCCADGSFAAQQGPKGNSQRR